jgi:cytochrome c peroxidase
LKKAVLGLALVGVCVALAFPIINLLTRREASQEPLLLAQNPNPYAKQAAQIFSQKCSDCHTSKTDYPFYFSLPVAKQVIAQDIQAGRNNYELTTILFVKNDRIPENYLSKLERVIADNSMPPARYTLMHWNARLTSQDKQVLLNWISAERHKSAMQVTLWNEPIQPLKPYKNLDPKKVALGTKLFNEKRLSGDNTLSCASCHDLQKGGTDRAKVSTGISNQKGGINAPTVFNSANNFVAFWDGRAANLNEQAAGPVENPIEMGAKFDDVIRKLNADPVYVAEFRKAYGNKGISKETITDAIATFEKTLITPNSRFDQYLMGNANALSPAEKQGYALFKSEGCASCHMGPNLGGLTYETLGKRSDYFKARGTALTAADKGRYNVTQKQLDLHRFKVPTLRNIAQTAPYFHDASTSDLKEAVRVMAKYQLGKNLTAQQVDEIAQFLQTLTGEYQGKPVQ